MKNPRKNKFNSKKFTACLIGLGNVGYGNYLLKEKKQILDHYTAISNQKNMELKVAIDKKGPKSLEKLTRKSITELTEKEFDLVVIATPTSTHFSIVSDLLKKVRARIILIEKPATSTLKELKLVKNLVKNPEATKIFVNYHRNYDEVFIKSFYKNNFGNLQCGVVHYSNGALNNASHALSLILPLFGNISEVRVSSHKNIDPLTDFNFEIQNSFGVKVVFLVTKESNYSNFRIELDFDRGVISYDAAKGEINERARIADPNFKKRNCLEREGIRINTNETEGFKQVYDFITNKLGDQNLNEVHGVDIDAAIRIHKIFDDLIRNSV